MHGSKQKKECTKCNVSISVPNFNKHFVACLGPKIVKTEWVCELCEKKFNTAQGYVGHKSRSHNPEQQRAAGIKGNVKKKKMVANGHVFVKYSHTKETKELLSIKACERLAKHSKYSKNTEYKLGVILESSFEVRTAKILDKLGVEWIKVRRGYIWDDNGKRRRYVPDFYLPKQNIFLDPKNDYLIKKDKRKIESAMKLNNIKVIVLADDMINEELIELLVL